MIQSYKPCGLISWRPVVGPVVSGRLGFAFGWSLTGDSIVTHRFPCTSTTTYYITCTSCKKIYIGGTGRSKVTCSAKILRRLMKEMTTKYINQSLDISISPIWQRDSFDSLRPLGSSVICVVNTNNGCVGKYTSGTGCLRAN